MPYKDVVIITDYSFNGNNFRLLRYQSLNLRKQHTMVYGQNASSCENLNIFNWQKPPWSIFYTVAVCDCVFHLYNFLHSRSRRLCFVSVRFLSSVNISKSYISDMTRPILTRLGHKYRLTIPFMSYDQIGVKGHVGVTGVKKVIFTKKSFKSNRLRSVITWLMYMIDLDPLYKSYGSRKSSGVIWGHWGQKFIFPKNAITRPCYIAWP